MIEPVKKATESNINWHRLFGLTLTDFFTDSSYEVELEKELTLQQQFVDAIIIKKNKEHELPEVPDGLDNLSDYNLISYKSHQESLTDWVLEELIEYFALYRKLISPSSDKLIASQRFSLYVVSTRYPKKLFNQINCKRIQEGVYEFKPILKSIRIIILKEIIDKPENAIWDLFSAKAEKVRYGASHYRWKRSHLNTVINRLFEKYQLEGLNMPYTVDDYKKDLIKEGIKDLSSEELEEVLKKLPPEDRLKGLPPEKVLNKYSSEDRLKGLPPEDRLKGLPPEDRLKGLSTEELEEYLRKLGEDKAGN